jgi:hypothetical protein
MFFQTVPFRSAENVLTSGVNSSGSFLTFPIDSQSFFKKDMGLNMIYETGLQ